MLLLILILILTLILTLIMTLTLIMIMIMTSQVSEEGAKVICIAIKMNPALKLLSLSRNALPDDAKRALYDAWSQREVEDGLSRSGM